MDSLSVSTYHRRFCVFFLLTCLCFSLRLIAGTLPIDEAQGVHSLTDVSVFANGPGATAFRGVCKSLNSEVYT